MPFIIWFTVTTHKVNHSVHGAVTQWLSQLVVVSFGESVMQYNVVADSVNELVSYWVCCFHLHTVRCRAAPINRRFQMSFELGVSQTSITISQIKLQSSVRVLLNDGIRKEHRVIRNVTSSQVEQPYNETHEPRYDPSTSIERPNIFNYQCMFYHWLVGLITSWGKWWVRLYGMVSWLDVFPIVACRSNGEAKDLI